MKSRRQPELKSCKKSWEILSKTIWTSRKLTMCKVAKRKAPSQEWTKTSNPNREPPRKKCPKFQSRKKQVRGWTLEFQARPANRCWVTRARSFLVKHPLPQWALLLRNLAPKPINFPALFPPRKNQWLKSKVNWLTTLKSKRKWSKCQSMICSSWPNSPNSMVLQPARLLTPSYSQMV